MKKKPLINGLPSDFVERLQLQFPEQVNKILESFQQRPATVRTNTLLTKGSVLQKELKKEGVEMESLDLLPDSFLVTKGNRRQLTDSDAYKAGLFYIQSIASQLAVKALDPQPGEKILDLCSAPGSKTTQIGIAMKKQGELMANDINRKRLYRLKANLEHQQLDDFVEVKNYSGLNYPKFFPDHFDRVLVDAPCSSESRFDRENPKSMSYWSRHKVRSFTKDQKRLLEAGIACTKPGGTIVYSTCTFSPDENEMIIENILKKHPEVSIDALDWKVDKLPILSSWNGKYFSKELQKTIRLFPNKIQEGFFICRFRKKSL